MTTVDIRFWELASAAFWTAQFVTYCAADRHRIDTRWARLKWFNRLIEEWVER